MKTTLNTLVEQLSNRAAELANLPIDSLRAMMPDATATRAELVALHKDMRLDELVSTILYNEFSEEFDFVIDSVQCEPVVKPEQPRGPRLSE
jgi:hypothetical protein